MSSNDPKNLPLCVDLDGTLLRSDMLLETTLLLIKQNLLNIFRLPFWLAKGKANLKHEVASRVNIDEIELPLNQEVVGYIKSENANRKIVLVTGSSQQVADKVASVTNLFDEVVGSNADTNFTRSNKSSWLVDRFGEKGFDYIGNDKDDYEVWPAARQAMVVSTPDGIASENKVEFSKVFTIEKPGIKDYLNLLRVHQWSKNVLVFIPFILDQRLNDTSALLSVLLAFCAMCLLASATYIINDMLDLQSDRQNATKSKRALASGRVSIATGAKVAILLVVLMAVMMLNLPPLFNLILLGYAVVTLLYSFYLKRVALLDVCIIAALHTVRVVAGTVAIAAEWSFWLLAFSMFIFFSFALIKRVAELIQLKEAGKEYTLGRDYQVSDIPLLMSIGASAGYLSVLIVALYINSEKVQRLYNAPEILWLVCPLLMYWIGRLWLKTSRGLMHEDPIVFAMRDRVSVYVIGFSVLVVIAARIVSI